MDLGSPDRSLRNETDSAISSNERVINDMLKSFNTEGVYRLVRRKVKVNIMEDIIRMSMKTQQDMKQDTQVFSENYVYKIENLIQDKDYIL